MAHDRLVHIHRLPVEPCIACGTVASSDVDFLTSPGDWNREARTCSPLKRVAPNFVLIPRADPRTSAIKEERDPDLKRVRDPR